MRKTLLIGIVSCVAMGLTACESRQEEAVEEYYEQREEALEQEYEQREEALEAEEERMEERVEEGAPMQEPLHEPMME